MIGGSAARRYAKALLLIAQQHGNPDTFNTEVERLAQTYEKNPELRRVLQNPAFSLAQRQAVLDDHRSRRSTSAAAKNAVAVFKISLALRNSAFSLRNAVSSAAGSWPSSRGVEVLVP